MDARATVTHLVKHLASGAVKVVDLTAPLGPDTPVIELPPEAGKNSPRVKVHKISRYDQDGPLCAWNWMELGEHTGTHFDAPVHWYTGKALANASTDTIPLQDFIAPVVVIDRSKEVQKNPDYLLTAESIREWEAEHGTITHGSWVLLRTDWHKRNTSTKEFLNVDGNGPHSPGPAADAIAYLLDRGALGFGSETVGTDAGSAFMMDPPFPAHHYLHGAGRYGLASLANLDQLPPTGAILIAAPLKLVGGTGSPLRVVAIVPT
ncbi:cyclase family protein [Bradyrhizobium sp. CCBAU 53338]|uniref:cyclase family protein n=1 Tax=Bradyrhizobium sp. CCBAU 53338 TaxID=1325111 RepID=UPI00188CA836|nr:cyclase family protein [Bradyrhizobium sp. CCBAU 53338]QOZ52523.1 cyclase family protein [Bradyrhizobium sp. CCBAU 53338]